MVPCATRSDTHRQLTFSPFFSFFLLLLLRIRPPSRLAWGKRARSVRLQFEWIQHVTSPLPNGRVDHGRQQCDLPEWMDTMRMMMNELFLVVCDLGVMITNGLLFVDYVRMKLLLMMIIFPHLFH
jgi:hypothetical protein